MSYMEAAMERQYEAWMEQEREWYDMCNQLAHDGWVHVSLNRQLNTQEMSELRKWMNEHYYGRYEQFNDELLLPTDRDANWVLLRWS